MSSPSLRGNHFKSLNHSERILYKIMQTTAQFPNPLWPARTYRCFAQFISAVSLLTTWTVASGQPVNELRPTAVAGPPIGSSRAERTFQQFPSRGARTDQSIPPQSPSE